MVTNPGALPKPGEVLHLFVTPEKMAEYRAHHRLQEEAEQSRLEAQAQAQVTPQQQQQELDEQAARTLELLKKEGAGEILKHMGMLAKIIKSGIDGLPTLFFREDIGVISEKAIEELEQVMRAKGREGLAPSSDDCADVLERYADTMPLQILEAAMDDLPIGHQIGVALGKAAVELFVLRNQRTKKDLMENTEEMALTAVHTMCIKKEHWEEMVPTYEIMITHPRIVRWICRFVRYYFHVMRPEDIELARMYDT